MSSFKGKIKWSGLISNPDGENFHNQIKEMIDNKCDGLYTEIQYQPLLKTEGQIIFTAFIIGRECD